MAAKAKDTEPKMTPSQMKKKIDSLENKITKITEGGYCYMCDKHKPKIQFYKSTDPKIASGITPICKACAYDIAMRKDANGEYHEPTKDSLKEALKYLNKPYLESVFNSSVQEANNDAIGRTKNNFFTSYMKNIAMTNYYGLTWQDSDMFKEHIVYEDEKTAEDVVNGREDQDTYADFIKNKNDVIRLLSYDPFEQETISDQPFLYAQLLGLLDSSEEGNDDMLRTSSCISIVRAFLQQSKIDDSISKLMSDISQLQKNSGTIKSLQDSKKALTGIIKDLAAESCISLKNSKNAKKGENTWTGKVKRIKELNLREGEVNGFDIWTAKGMQQVMELSDASIMKQLRLDESEWSDMVAEQRTIIRSLQDERDNYQEISRILLRENIDMRDYLQDNDLLDENTLINLDDLYSVFSAEYEEVPNDDGYDEDNENSEEFENANGIEESKGKSES